MTTKKPLRAGESGRNTKRVRTASKVHVGRWTADSVRRFNELTFSDVYWRDQKFLTPEALIGVLGHVLRSGDEWVAMHVPRSDSTEPLIFDRFTRDQVMRTRNIFIKALSRKRSK